SAGSIWTAPNSIADICVPKFKSKKNSTLECSGSEWTQKVDLTLKGADVLNDQYGPSWVTAVINAIGTNPTCTSGSDVGQTFWNNTAIIITWDDWGGWSDNQPALTQPGLPCTS